MTRFVTGRIFGSLLLILAALTCIFFFIHLAPGDPVELFLGHDSTEEQRLIIESKLGLDKPIYKQFGSWITGVILHGDLGDSLRSGRPVANELADVIPNTLFLAACSFILHLIIAIPLGVWMAHRSGSKLERFTMSTGLMVYSLPSFWLGLMLILVFCRLLGWLPSGGMNSIDLEWMSPGQQFLDTLRHLVLPVFVLGVSTVIGTARYVRTSVLEVLQKDFILSARARGLSKKRILWNHALRNSLLPIITIVGLNIPFLLGGAVITETIFSWPGMGRLTVEAIFARDYPIIMGTVTVSAFMVVLGNLLADLGYAFVDPRIKLRSGGGK
ncbi:MAG: ABC transporter permease [bacterium]|nr:ABC transporter permease [bacterium]